MELKEWIGGVIALFVVVAGLMIFGGIGQCHNDARNAVKNAVVSYEQFESMYSACKQIDADICGLRSLPKDDKMFDQFSADQLIFTKKTQLNRWMEEYNAKSRMITKGTWKSQSLPEELTIELFDCAGK